MRGFLRVRPNSDKQKRYVYQEFYYALHKKDAIKFLNEIC